MHERNEADLQVSCPSWPINPLAELRIFVIVALPPAFHDAGGIVAGFQMMASLGTLPRK